MDSTAAAIPAKLTQVVNNFQQQKFDLASLYNGMMKQEPMHHPGPQQQLPSRDQSVLDDDENKENTQPQPPLLERIPFDPTRYRYQMRKPVESWKYAEVRKTDGSFCYQCRVCACSYKHKKSLNKHWRDKHSGIPRPEGYDDDDDDEDDAASTSENESTSPPPLPPLSQSLSTTQMPALPSFALSGGRPLGRQSMFANVSPSKFMQQIKREPYQETCTNSPKRRHSVLPQPFALQSIFHSMFGKPHESMAEDQPQPVDLSLHHQPAEMPVQQPPPPPPPGGPAAPPQPKFDLSLLKILLRSVLSALDSENQASSVAEITPATFSLLQAIGSLLSVICKPSSVLEQPAQYHQPVACPMMMPALPKFLPSHAAISLANVTSPITTLTTTPKRSFYRHSISHTTGRKMMIPSPGLQSISSQPESPSFLAQQQHQQSSPACSRASSADGRRKSVDPMSERMGASTGNEPIGPIGCKLCSFEARWFSELRAHMVNHSEHRMFGCCYCIYRAKWKWDVAKHMRRCALARHVAHMPNESLLRMVKYLPPPSTDILYEYFPKHSYPGVGTERPLTPPQQLQQSNRSTPSLTEDGHLQQHLNVSEMSRPSSATNTGNNSMMTLDECGSIVAGGDPQP